MDKSQTANSSIWSPKKTLGTVPVHIYLCVQACTFNQFTSGILYFIFSVKIRKRFLAINNFSVNETKPGQPNKRLFSLTFRELNGYFFYYGRLSSTQLDRWQAPMQRPIIDQHLVEQTAYLRERSKTMDINPSLQILGWYVKGTGLG